MIIYTSICIAGLKCCTRKCFALLFCEQLLIEVLKVKNNSRSKINLTEQLYQIYSSLAQEPALLVSFVSTIFVALVSVVVVLSCFFFFALCLNWENFFLLLTYLTVLHSCACVVSFCVSAQLSAHGCDGRCLLLLDSMVESSAQSIWFCS